MHDLPATWAALCTLAFALGAKHGLDADHLATIDGLTRSNAGANPRLSRLCGSLFSLGHGAVVLFVALAAGALASRWETPRWLEISGIAVSVVFLFGLALINVRAVMTTPAGAVVATAGLKSRLLGSLTTARRGWAVAAVGALFAVSFDTISQASLFALAASRFGGVAEAVFLAALFVLGMLAIDGVNGMWISALIRRADRRAVIASRVMTLAVAGVSLAVGVFTVTKVLIPAVDAWSDGREILVGASVVVAVAVAFAVAMIAARRSPSRPARDVVLAGD